MKVYGKNSSSRSFANSIILRAIVTVVAVLIVAYLSLLIILRIETNILVNLDRVLLSKYCTLSILCQKYQNVRNVIDVDSISNLMCGPYGKNLASSHCLLIIKGLRVYPKSFRDVGKDTIALDVPAISIENIEINAKFTGHRIDVFNITTMSMRVNVVYENIFLSERSISPLLELIPPPPKVESYPKIGVVSLSDVKIFVIFAPLQESAEFSESEDQSKIIADIKVSEDILYAIEKITIESGRKGIDQRDMPKIIDRICLDFFSDIVGNDAIFHLRRIADDSFGLLDIWKTNFIDEYERWKRLLIKEIESSFEIFDNDINGLKLFWRQHVEQTKANIEQFNESLMKHTLSLFDEIFIESGILVEEALEKAMPIVSDAKTNLDQLKAKVSKILIPVAIKVHTEANQWKMHSLRKIESSFETFDNDLNWLKLLFLRHIRQIRENIEQFNKSMVKHTSPLIEDFFTEFLRNIHKMERSLPIVSDSKSNLDQLKKNVSKTIAPTTLNFTSGKNKWKMKNTQTRIKHKDEVGFFERDGEDDLSSHKRQREEAKGLIFEAYSRLKFLRKRSEP